MDYKKCKKFIKRLKKIEKISDPDESAQALSELIQEMRHNGFEFPPVYRRRIAEIRQLIEGYATRTVSKKRYQTNTFKGVVIALVIALLGGGIPAWLSLGNKRGQDLSKNTHIDSEAKISGDSTPASVIDLETDFPAKFGDSRKDVWTHLGKPQEARVVWDCFYSEGLNIYYDRHTKEVDGFHISRLPSGVSYPGRVLGVRLGDSFDKAKMLHGRPEHWGLPEEDASLAIWQKDNDLRLIIAVSRSGPDAGRILSITYCRENSFANYIPIAATTLQELRNGRPLSFAEEGGDPFFASELRPDNPLFQMAYDIVDASLGMMGGAIITVYFKNSEVVLLWIYPLGWTQPRVRMIVKPDEIGSG